MCECRKTTVQDMMEGHFGGGGGGDGSKCVGEDVEGQEQHKQQQQEKQQQQQEKQQQMGKEEYLGESHLPEEVTSFEDLMEVVGTKGRWNVLIFLLCSFSGVCAAGIVMSYQFLGATPDHWCHVEPLVDAHWSHQQILSLAIPYSNNTRKYSGCYMYDYNYTTAATLGYDSALNNSLVVGSPDIVACHKRDFNTSQYRSTIVTQWDLVCENRVLYSTVQASNQLGFLFSSLLCGYLMDLLGRRAVALGSLVMTIFLGFLSILSPTPYVFIALRFSLSVAAFPVYLSNFLIVMESCSSSTRSTVGALYVVPWAVGYMLTPAVAYWVRDWQWLQAVLTLPYLLMLVGFWALPESPRWLILHNRENEAVDVLTRIARINKRTLPPRHVFLEAVSHIRAQMCPSTDSDDEVKETTTGRKVLRAVKQVFFILTKKELRRRLLIMFTCWFVASLVYYGLSLSATNLSADPYLFIFLGGLLEVPSYLLVWWCVMYLGRRSTLASLYLLCAVCICFNAVLIYSFPQETPVGAKIFLSLCGKIGIAAAFHLLFVYTAELFPTEWRSISLGECNSLGRIGSIASPYINDLVGEASSWAPSALFAGASLLAAALSLLLPETKGQVLTESHFAKGSHMSLGPPTPPPTPRNSKQTEMCT